MGKLIVFNSISLDGYFVDRNGEMAWAHNPNPDQAWDAYVATNASEGGVLLFGRKTYQLMEAYWPTPLAIQNDPIVAARMNALRKVVFSTTLDKVTWTNSQLVRAGMVSHIQMMKQAGEQHMVILGSGSLVAQLSRVGLIDEYQFVVIPVVLGGGRTLFEGLQEKMALSLNSSRRFENGNVVLDYSPVLFGA